MDPYTEELYHFYHCLVMTVENIPVMQRSLVFDETLSSDSLIVITKGSYAIFLMHSNLNLIMFGVLMLFAYLTDWTSA